MSREATETERRRQGRYDGYAFPGIEKPGGGYPGMTLRDYFAAKALLGILSGKFFDRTGRVNVTDTGKVVSIDPEDVAAEWAYRFADAMIRARDAEGKDA